MPECQAVFIAGLSIASTKINTVSRTSNEMGISQEKGGDKIPWNLQKIKTAYEHS
jgi:hypothetical protein